MGTRHTQFYMDKEYPNTVGGGGGGGAVVEYCDFAQFSGADRIVLPFKINADYKITVTFQAPTYKNDNSIIGNTNGSNYSHCTIYSNRYYVSTGNGETNFSEDLYGKHTFTTNDNGHNTFDGSDITNYTPTTKDDATLVLAGRNADGQRYVGKIYEYILESISTGVELMHLLPAKVIINGIVIAKGLVDSVSGEIYTCTGMTLGNDT